MVHSMVRHVLDDDLTILSNETVGKRDEARRTVTTKRTDLALDLVLVVNGLIYELDRSRFRSRAGRLQETFGIRCCVWIIQHRDASYLRRRHFQQIDPFATY